MTDVSEDFGAIEELSFRDKDRFTLIQSLEIVFFEPNFFVVKVKGIVWATVVGHEMQMARLDEPVGDIPVLEFTQIDLDPVWSGSECN